MNITIPERSIFDGNFWCIVIYFKTHSFLSSPLYYTGYYTTYGMPNISPAFDEALKLHSENEAKRIQTRLKFGTTHWTIESHRYM